MKKSVALLGMLVSMSVQASEFVGKYVGDDPRGNPCTLQILTSEEAVDPQAKSYSPGERFTQVKRVMTVTTSFTGTAVSKVQSTFNTLWEGYDVGRLRGMDADAGRDVWLLLKNEGNDLIPNQVLVYLEDQKSFECLRLRRE